MDYVYCLEVVFSHFISKHVKKIRFVLSKNLNIFFYLQHKQQQLSCNPIDTSWSYGLRHIADSRHHISKCKPSSIHNRWNYLREFLKSIFKGTYGQFESTNADREAFGSSTMVQKISDSLLLYGPQTMVRLNSVENTNFENMKNM